MKIVQINATCENGSTGKICVGISNCLSQNGMENYIFYSLGTSDFPSAFKYASNKYIRMQALKSHICGNYGFNSICSTKRILAELERIQPDVVHLHNIHSHDCNLGLLFTYFRQNHTKVFWTFHDCWAFTAYCPHFTMAKCEKWKSSCSCCPQHREYSFFFDNPCFIEKNNCLTIWT